MALSGVGTVTGLRSVFQLDGAVILDSERVFDYIKKSIEVPHQEKTGAPGFRAVAGEFRGRRVAIVQVPPYPQAAVEAASELYLLGARRLVIVTRAYRLSRRLSQNAVLVASAAISADAITHKIVPPGTPLLASANMLSKTRSIVEVRFPDIEWYVGFTVTVDSPRLRYFFEEAEKYANLKGVVAVDSMIAPVYALQYEYTNLEAIALATIVRSYTKATTTIESSEEAAAKTIDREVRSASLLVTVALEVLGYESKI